MLQFFNGRHLRYEFHALIEGRWQLVAVTDDDRDSLKRRFDSRDLQDLEMQVQQRAEAILRQPGVSAIKVLRERLRKGGSGSGEEIFRRENPPTQAPAPRVKDYSGDVPLCQTVDDLFRRPARRLIGVMLRPLLDQLCMTPIELLTLHGASKAVSRADDAINTVIMRAAQRQTTQFGGDIRERASLLTKLADDTRQKIRKAEALGLPNGTPENFDAVLSQLEQRQAEDYGFHTFRSFCILLRSSRSLGAKLELTIEIAARCETQQAQVVADAMLADLMDHPEAIQDLLGPQPDLRRAIQMLLQLVQGVPSQGSKLNMLLGSLLQQTAFSDTREAIYDRLLRSLSGKAPLTHGDLNTEWKAIDALTSSLIPALPAHLHPPALAALGTRQERLQAASFALVENG